MTNNKGVSILEVLIAVGVMSIMSLAFSQLFMSQLKMNKQLSQKLESTDLNNFLLQIFQNQSTCNANFQGKQIDITTPTNIPNIPIPTITSGLNQVLAKNNTLVNGTQTELMIDTIDLTNIRLVATQYYQAVLRISFKSNSNTMVPRPITINQLFNTTASGANAVDITSCVTPGDAVNIVITTNNNNNNANNNNNNTNQTPSAQIQNVSCAANAGCWIPLSFTGSPGMSVIATATCLDGSGNNIGGTNNSVIGAINGQGSFQYTGMWDCTTAPKSGCTQSYTVGGVNVGSHSWQCQ